MKESLKKNTKIIADEMVEKYGYLFCEMCGRNNGRIHIHHIMYRSEKPNHPMLHHKDNLLICCEKCHRALHAKKSLRKKIVDERNLKTLFK